MSSKNRTIAAFNNAVQEYCKFKSENSDSTLQRCLQVLCSMENIENLSAETFELLDFLVNLRDLLSNAINLPLGWKAIHLCLHLTQNKEILKFFKNEVDLLPVVAQYSILQQDAEKTTITLNLLHKLLESVVFLRFSSYVPTLLHSLVQLVLHKKQEYSHLALSVLANISVNNSPVFTEIERLEGFDDFIRLIAQSTAADIATQLNAALVLVLHKIETSVADGRFYRFFNFLLQVSQKAVQENNKKHAEQVALVFGCLSGHCVTSEVLQGPECQNFLQKLISGIWEKFPNNSATFNFTAKLMELGIIVEKEVLDFLTPKLIERLEPSEGNIEPCLELLLSLIKGQANNSFTEKMENSQQTEDLIHKLLNILSSDEDLNNFSFYQRTVLSLRLLQKLCKFRTQLTKISCGIQPSYFSSLVQKISASTRLEEYHLCLVLEALTLLNQLACQGGDWLQTYSQVVSQTDVQVCLARALLFGDRHYRQATLSLVGNIGFTNESIAALSDAMGSLQKPSNDFEPKKELKTPNPDPQWNRLHRLLDKLEKQQYQQFTTSDVIELLEARLKRSARHQQTLMDNLKSAEKQISNLKLENTQIQSENDRFLSVLLSKDEMLKAEQSNSRTLSKRLEKAFLLNEESKAAFAKEKAKLDDIINNQCKEIENLREDKAQLENQYQLLHAKYDDCALELKKTTQEYEILVESLTTSLKEKESELFSREKENESLKCVAADLKKELQRSELLCKDYQDRIAESERKCQETKEELIKLERIRQYIHDLSAGNKKLLD